MKSVQTARGQGQESSPGIQEHEAPVPAVENSVMQAQLAGAEGGPPPDGDTPTLDLAANEAANSPPADPGASQEADSSASQEADPGASNAPNARRAGGGLGGLLGGGSGKGTKKLKIVPFTVADGKARTTVGVGEKMKFHCNEAGTTWSATKGSGNTTRKAGFVDIYDWTAPNKKGSATISVTTAKGAGQLKITVIQPSSMTATVTGPYPVTGTGAGMKLAIVFNPTTVNFQYLQWKEKEASATNISGYFKKHTPPNHDKTQGSKSKSLQLAFSRTTSVPSTRKLAYSRTRRS